MNTMEMQKHDLLNADGANDFRPLALRSIFWRPDFVTESPWSEHIPFAFWLVEAHQPRVVVELGCDSGTSYFAFCQAVDRLGMDSRCFAFGEWSGAEVAAQHANVHAYNEARYSGFSRVLPCHSDEALSSFASGSVDVLHVNASSDSGLLHRLAPWLPKLSDRGVILIHGVASEDDAFAGENEVFFRAYPRFKFFHGAGLAVIGTGPAQGHLVSRLFKAAGDEVACKAVHEVFARVGRACVDHHAAVHHRELVAALSTQLATQQKQIDETKLAMDKVRSDLTARNKDLTEARNRLQVQTEQHAVERGLLGERTNLLQEIRAELKDQVASLQSHLEAAQRELAQRNDQIQSLAAAAAEHKAHASINAEKLAARDIDLAKHQESLKRARADLAEAVKTRQASEERLIDVDGKLVRNAAEIERLGAAVRDGGDALARTQEAVATLEAVRCDLEERLLAAEAVAQDRLAQAGHLELELQGRATLLQERDRRIAELHGELQALHAAQAELSAERQELAADLEQAQRAASEAQQREDCAAQQVQADRVEWEERLRARYQQIAELRAQAAERANDAGRLRQELSRAEASLQARFAETAQLTRVLQEQEKRLVVESGMRATLEAEVKQLSKALTSAEQAREQQVADLKARVVAHQKEAVRLAAIEAEARGRLNSRFEEIAKLTAMVQSLEQQRDASRNELAAQHEELTSKLERTRQDLANARLLHEAECARLRRLKQTASWKVTLPLRLAMKPFRASSKPAAAGARQQKMLRESGVFDEAWYLQRYDDVKRSGMDPVEHYVRFGAAEGRDPAPGFNASEYLARHPGLAASRANPLLHYLLHAGKDAARTSAN